MATDIAFALGALAVLGKSLPAGLRAFLSAVAIADDLGAVLVIALFYTETISGLHLAISLLFLAALALANFLWVRATLVYALLGVGLWLAIVGSGVHATVAGVLAAFFIPAKGKYDTDKFVRGIKTMIEEFECEPQGCGRSILLNEASSQRREGAIALAANHAENPSAAPGACLFGLGRTRRGPPLCPRQLRIDPYRHRRGSQCGFSAVGGHHFRPPARPLNNTVDPIIPVKILLTRRVSFFNVLSPMSLQRRP